MNKVQIIGLFFNLIIYLIMIFPIFLVILKRKKYFSKKIVIKDLILITIFEIIFSFILYKFSRNIFGFFTKVTGIINYSIYASKILFITSSLYGLKFLIPYFLLTNSEIKENFSHKKTAILFFSKIAVNLFFIFLGYLFFSNKGILYAFTICDLIYYIIYSYLFIKI